LSDVNHNMRVLIATCWDQLPEQRPFFPQIVDELKELFEALGPPLPSRPSQKSLRDSGGLNVSPAPKSSPVTAKPKPPPPKPKPTNGYEENLYQVPPIKPPAQKTVSNSNFNGVVSQYVYIKEILLEFMINSGGKCPWKNFAHYYQQVSLVAQPDLIQNLEFLFNDHGIVTRERIEDIGSRFVPLIAENDNDYNYLDQIIGGFTPIAIYNSVCYPWFHGFISFDEANSLVQNKPEGAFLIRFSNVYGCYALAVQHEGVVHNWRINGTPESRSFELNNQYYQSLNQIVITHMNVPLKIHALSNTGKEDVYLRAPVSRDSF